MKTKPIISCEEFQKLVRKNSIIIDSGSGESAYQNYLEKHISGAFYVDLNKDLSEIPDDAKNGGRHPLSSVEKFEKLLQKFGIDENFHIIIYDDKNASNASAGFWWMLKVTLSENGLGYIPEAHNYLKIGDDYFDYTMPNTKYKDFADKILAEKEIEFNQISKEM